MSDAAAARRGRVLWGVLAAIWLAFFAWYTSFAGPLTPEEVDHYVGLMESRGRSPEDVATIRAFLESDTGDDFVMVNVIDLHQDPPPVEGVPDDATADEILDRYMAYMWPALLSRACHPIFFGQAAAPALDLFGIEGAERWSRGALMRYRSRRDMLEIATNTEFEGAHAYKIAAMVKTIAFPVDPWGQLGDPRFVLALVLSLTGLGIERAWRR